MKSLNQKSVAVFTKLIDKLNGNRHMKIANDGYMDLSLERLQTEVKTAFGMATIYSLAHYYEQNGDLMSDPEMTFIYVDSRTTEHQDLIFVGIYPESCTDSNFSTYRLAIDRETNRYSPRIFRDLCAFANTWLNNISRQGFLKCDVVIDQH